MNTKASWAVGAASEVVVDHTPTNYSPVIIPHSPTSDHPWMAGHDSGQCRLTANHNTMKTWQPPHNHVITNYDHLQQCASDTHLNCTIITLSLPLFWCLDYAFRNKWVLNVLKEQSDDTPWSDTAYESVNDSHVRPAQQSEAAIKDDVMWCHTMKHCDVTQHFCNTTISISLAWIFS